MKFNLSKREMEELKSLKKDLVDPVRSFAGEVYADTVGDAKAFYSAQARQTQETVKRVRRKTEEQMAAAVRIREGRQRKRKASARRLGLLLAALAVLGILLVSVALSVRGGKTGPSAPAGTGTGAAEETAAGGETPLALSGTWQTASMGFAADGSMQPEYDVQFTDTAICYGHRADGEFVPDHADPIVRLDKLASGGYRVQAEAANGVRYTYQTSEGDENVLEYYETWDEADFPDMYRGGASLSRGVQAAG